MTSYDDDLMVFRVSTSAGQVTVPMQKEAGKTLVENEAAGFATLKVMFAEGLAAVDRQLEYARTPLAAESWPLGGEASAPRAA